MKTDQRYFLPLTEYTRRKSTDTLVIHCSDTTAKQDVDVSDIRGWHVNERGWKDVGYHVVITRDGVVQTGRPLWAVGAHVEGLNATSIGVCMVGGRKAGKAGGEEDNFEDAQWDALLKVVRGILKSHKTLTKVIGHRDVKGVKKYCPSFDVAAWMRENKKDL